jgi:hypothetical protein
LAQQESIMLQPAGLFITHWHGIKISFSNENECKRLCAQDNEKVSQPTQPSLSCKQVQVPTESGQRQNLVAIAARQEWRASVATVGRGSTRESWWAQPARHILAPDSPQPQEARLAEKAGQESESQRSASRKSQSHSKEQIQPKGNSSLNKCIPDWHPYSC